MMEEIDAYNLLLQAKFSGHNFLNLAGGMKPIARIHMDPFRFNAKFKA